MPPTPFWAKPRFVLSIILLYLAVHFAIRWVVGPALATDDAEQALFSQHFAWSYRYRAPPLFTWILVALGEVMPIGVVAISLIRYGLLGVTYVFAYLSARRLIADPRLAALAVYSFAAIHTFSESSHRELTHTTTLAAFIAVAWYVFIRLCAAPKLGWYLALGATFGLGMLAKWNFVILATTLPIACLIRRDFRPILLTWKILPAAALAATIVLPTGIATLRAGAPAGDDVQSVFSVTAERGLGQITKGTLQLLHTAIIYPEPLLPILLILLGLPLWRGLRAEAPQASSIQLRPDPAFIGTTMAVGLMLLWVIVPAVGATEFKVRYMYPALFILPTWLFMLVERGQPANWAIQLFSIVLIAPALQVPIERLRESLSADDCGLCLQRAEFGHLADELTAAGYQGTGTLIADSFYAGGNLRVEFPRARIIDPRFPLSSWPEPSDNGPCLLVWQAAAASPLAAGASRQTAYLADVLHGDPSASHRDGEVSVAFHNADVPPYRMRYRLFDQPIGDCR
jgi:4-amino-4-deoxy-L-arabinose transferase-like glycosyltransferase